MQKLFPYPYRIVFFCVCVDRRGGGGGGGGGQRKTNKTS